MGVVVWSVPVPKNLALTPYIGQARKDRARARLCAGCGSQQIGHNSEVCMISLLFTVSNDEGYGFAMRWCLEVGMRRALSSDWHSLRDARAVERMTRV